MAVLGKKRTVCAKFEPAPSLTSARKRCAMTDYRNPAWTEEGRFRGALDDVIIIPLVFVTLAANKILRFILSILMRLLGYAFPLAMQIVWLPISFGAATAMHAVLFAKLTSWPAWMQLLHPLATVIAKSKLLVLPVYPAAWPHAKKHPF